MKRIVSALYKFGYERRAFVILVLCAAAAIALPAQTLTTIHTFCVNGDPCLDGAGPQGPLVEGFNGNLYGSTQSGGTAVHSNGLDGTIFTIALGKLTTIYNFCSLPGCADGGQPAGSLAVAKNSGDLYGTTLGGGANSGPDGIGGGSIFKITPTGALTTLYSFCSQPNCADGYQSISGLVQASNGDYYGTTYRGGIHGGGTVFKISAAGAYQRLYSFCSKPNCADGGGPVGALVQGDDGNLYGTAEYGGASPHLSDLPLTRQYSGTPGGTVFKITLAGKLTTVYSFCSEVSGDVCTDGEGPTVLVNGADGNLYGVTPIGGAHAGGAPEWDPTLSASGDGTIYKITPNGEFTTLYNFCSQPSSEGECTDGEFPTGLVQANDGNLYGTTGFGGAGLTGPAVSSRETGLEEGTIFKITPNGTLTTLHDFCSQTGDSEKNGCSDGYDPTSLAQAANGNFFGTASSLKTNKVGLGEVYRFSLGLNPFVETLPKSSTIGSTITILGNNLARATSVSFNGIAAEFKVVSATEISATVPSGATSGTVQVLTLGGALQSNAPFEVLP